MDVTGQPIELRDDQCVLVIETGRASRFHRDRHARFGNELLRGLVEANQRTIVVAWPRIDGQHVFHNGYERAVGLRRDDPVLAAMGLKSVFLSARPIVLSLARSTMPSSTTLFCNLTVSTAGKSAQERSEWDDRFMRRVWLRLSSSSRAGADRVFGYCDR